MLDVIVDAAEEAALFCDRIIRNGIILDQFVFRPKNLGELFEQRMIYTLKQFGYECFQPDDDTAGDIQFSHNSLVLELKRQRIDNKIKGSEKTLDRLFVLNELNHKHLSKAITLCTFSSKSTRGLIGKKTIRRRIIN